MIELLFLALPLLALPAALCLRAYWRNTAFDGLIALAEAQSARAPFLREDVGLSGAEGPGVSLPDVSVVVPVQNDAADLSRLLPLLLSQRFVNYEVVVANAAAEDEATAEAVKTYREQHAHLRYTFVPDSHRPNVDAHKVAVTLGIRAARAPWVVILEPDCTPESDEWLAHLSRHFTSSHDVVMGYVNYADAPRPERVDQALEWGRRARSATDGFPAAASDSNVAFRREWFLASGGFSGSLDLNFGECALLAARAQPHRTAVELHPAGFVRRRSADLEHTAQRRREARVVHRRTESAARYVTPRECRAELCLAIGLSAALLYVVGRLFAFVPALHALCPSVRQGFTSLYGATVPAYAPEHLALDASVGVLVLLLLFLPDRGRQRLLRTLREA